MNKKTLWNRDTLSTADSNCVFLFDFVEAMAKYHPVSLKIKPLRKKVKTMEQDKLVM